jgi:thiol-disulfide isomerase/thioredoxin
MKALLPSPIALSLLLASLAACAPGTPSAEAVRTSPAVRLVGEWRAVLISPGGDLPFTLEVTNDRGALRAAILNGEERAPLSGVEVEGDHVTLRFDWYDSSIDARFESDDSLAGRWHKTVPEGVSALDFVATRGAGERFIPVHEERPEPSVTDVSGVWEVEFTDEDGTEVAQAEFRQDGTAAVGTFLTPTGDYRFLAGSYEGGLLRLSTFDGAHAFLFQARADDDGALVGDFWSRDTYHATWTARRSEAGETILPDAWSQVDLTNDEGSFHFAFDDLEGNRLTSDDRRFAGKVVVVNIFGSWCPNCNDEAPLLAEWSRRYRDRGLEIVGLAYEYSGDTDRDRVFVRRFAERHGVDYPLLLAGISDKEAAAETLPDITAVLAFPTTLFIGRDGKVRKVHSGFAGPGTGTHYDELKGELESLIESLLAEPDRS